MLVARALRSLTRLRRLQPLVGRLHAALLRHSGGRLRRSFVFAGGQPVLALTTTGRRTGRPHSTALAYLRHGRAYAVGALNLGSDRDPQWALNLRAQPAAWVDVDGRRLAVHAREAIGAEAEHLWAGFVRQLPQVANTRRVAERHVPLFVLEPAVRARSDRT
jgi:deazaflavin-dependent oxidoreductase (nitroreductase family)